MEPTWITTQDGKQLTTEDGKTHMTTEDGQTPPGKIEPALSAEEWAAGSLTEHMLHPDALFALWNHRLPDSDPRKITRETVAMLRRKARAFADSVYERESGEQWHDDAAPVRALADALESYLPPKET